ncbi:MAG: OmpA family protein [Desulfohalobiaceae bacterium]|nr:OmpA family protein [Desulfohalobiaceae bacterium]
MCWKNGLLFNVLLVFFIGLILGPSAFAKQYRPRVDNFLFLYDATSSMDENYQKSPNKKAALAIEAMQDINQDIPRIDIQSGLFLVSPSFDTYQQMMSYDSNAFEFAIDQFPLPARHIGPQTPLAEGLAELEPVLDRLSGSTALILFSDGGENRGGSPVDVLRELYGQYDVCMHFVSYAQQDEELEIINGMRALSDCSQHITGEAVQDDRARADFVRKILYRTVKDSDGDGVPDHLDKCPDTPKDLVVDKDGCPKAKRITLDIKFDFDKAVVKPQYHDELEKVAEVLKRRPKVDVVIEGHTDSIGSNAYNQKLSQRRAASVKDYLVEKMDISAERLSTVGYGETRPVAGNETAAGRQKNRRVEGVFPTIYQKKQ